MQNISRRTFLAGAAAVGCRAFGEDGSPAVPVDAEAQPPKISNNLAVLIADVHIPLPWSEQKYRTGQEYPWIIGQVKRFVGEILALRPRPAHVFCLGDVSIAFSEEREYEIAAQLLQPLEDAGIKLVMTVGNHDLREPFLKHLGKWVGETPVPGRVTSVTHLPDFDFVLLDSLKEPKSEDRGKYGALTSCDLGADQKKWLDGFLAAAERPVILGAHHTAGQLGLVKTVTRSPKVFGFIHGHNHKWERAYLFHGYNVPTPIVRSQGLPSFGIDRDVGYALLRSLPDRAELKYVARDYYFPRMVATEERPPLWDDIVRDNSSRKVTFPFKK